MILNRQMVIDRLKAGEKLEESGNGFLFKDGNTCSGYTEMWLRENNLVKEKGGLARRVLSWNVNEVKCMTKEREARLNELTLKIQKWDIKTGQTPQDWLDEYNNLWVEQIREDNKQKEKKSREMRNRRRKGHYGEKKVAKEVGGRKDGGVGRRDITAGIFSYEVKSIKKIPASITKIMAQAERLKKKGTIAVGVFRCNSPRQEFFIVERNDWLQLHGK